MRGATEKIVRYSQFQEEGVQHAMQGHRGEQQGQLGGGRRRRKMRARAVVVVSMEKNR